MDLQPFYLTIAYVYITACSAACPTPFTQLSGGHCAYWNASYSVNWCQAAEICLSIGGELAIDRGLIRAVRSQLGSAQVFVGFTDLLIERKGNRTGWQLTNGSIAMFDDADWDAGSANMAASDDFGILTAAGFTDTRLKYKRSVLCQPLVTPKSSWFRRVNFLRLGNISPYYCFTELTDVKVESQCAFHCGGRWQCRAAIYNTVDGRCRMLDFTDASVGNAIENDPDWRKLVKVY